MRPLSSQQTLGLVLGSDVLGKIATRHTSPSRSITGTADVR